MDNIRSYIGKEAAWHTLGKVTGHFLTWDEIAAQGGLDYEAEKRQLLDPVTQQKVEAWGTFRTDTGEFLGAVGEVYTVMQHSEGFRIADQLVGARNGAHYATAGSLGKGEIVWGLIDLSQTLHVGDDVHQLYLLMLESYNGFCKRTFRETDVRVVCQNTVNQSLSSKTQAKLSIRHTKNGARKMLEVGAVLNSLELEGKQLEEKLNFLAQRKMTREATVSILDRLFPKMTVEGGIEVSTPHRENVLRDVLSLYESNDRNAFPEQRGTAYNLLNAITDFADHKRGYDDNRAQSAVLGSGDVLKTKAFDYLMTTAEGLPVHSVKTLIAPKPSTGLLDQILDESVSH